MDQQDVGDCPPGSRAAHAGNRFAAKLSVTDLERSGNEQRDKEEEKKTLVCWHKPEKRYPELGIPCTHLS